MFLVGILLRYYKSLGKECSNNFLAYCEDDSLADEFEEPPDCMLAQFDSNLPFKSATNDNGDAYLSDNVGAGRSITDNDTSNPLLMWIPPENIPNKIPECVLNSSAACILPHGKYNNGKDQKNQKNINAQNKCLSYHVCPDQVPEYEYYWIRTPRRIMLKRRKYIDDTIQITINHRSKFVTTRYATKYGINKAVSNLRFSLYYLNLSTLKQWVKKYTEAKRRLSRQPRNAFEAGLNAKHKTKFYKYNTNNSFNLETHSKESDLYKGRENYLNTEKTNNQTCIDEQNDIQEKTTARVKKLQKEIVSLKQDPSFAVNSSVESQRYSSLGSICSTSSPLMTSPLPLNIESNDGCLQKLRLKNKQLKAELEELEWVNDDIGILPVQLIMPISMPMPIKNWDRILPQKNSYKQSRLDGLRNAMNQYSDHVNHKQNQHKINAPYKSTDISLLLTDFLYLLSENVDAEQFGVCNLPNCKIYHRKCRDRNKVINDDNVVYNQILDKMHCYLYHANDAVSEKSNNRYNQLTFNNTVEINDNKMYSFGTEFEYGYNNEEAHYNAISVSPKYSTLKQELTANPLSTISMNQFEIEYQKALIHFNCKYRKQYYSNIKLEHLLALMIYCNFDGLQHELTKTYRENNGVDHDNYYHWAKLLKMAVKMHGTKIAKGKINAFYHGIGDELLLPQYNGNGYGWSGVQIFCPLSTTSECAVAANFTNYKGLVIEFGGNAFRCNDTKYFSVQWLSDYSHESEYLFVQNQYGLQINNIINVQNCEEYRSVLNALKMFDEITTGYGTYNKSLDSVKIIENIFSKMMCDEVKSKYVREIFNTFCNNKRLMVLDYNKFKYKYPMLFSRLFTTECVHEDECELNIREILRTFRGLDVLNVNFCGKYISSTSFGNLIETFYFSSLNRIELWNVSVYYDSDELYAITQIYQRQFWTIKIMIRKEKEIYHFCIKRNESGTNY